MYIVLSVISEPH